ncbi:uncharacterized protein LOC142104134 [Mixophyes fleayi]|uniref:uncharacterized protein LOC142104134 n=1 Tax=Mixophyes fleayi TaxID=3061075 RepID=UPI003F4D851D
MSLQEKSNELYSLEEEVNNIKADLERSRAAAWKAYDKRKQLERKLLSMEEKEEWLYSQIIPYYHQNNWLEEEASRLCEQVSEQEIINKKLLEHQLGQTYQRKPVEAASEPAADNNKLQALVRAEVKRQLQARAKKEKKNCVIGLRLLYTTIMHLVQCCWKLAMISGILVLLFYIFMEVNDQVKCRCLTRSEMEYILRPFFVIQTEWKSPRSPKKHFSSDCNDFHSVYTAVGGAGWSGMEPFGLNTSQ